VELLKKLWTEGLSASQIAGRLGAGVTRNAVIGKVHRLNLSGRAQQPRSTQPRAPRKQREPSLAGGRPGGGRPGMPTAGSTALKHVLRAEMQPRPMALPEPKPLRLVDLPQGGRVTILHLSDKTCKWPIGDPGSEDFCFCGHGPRDGSPYCEYHARLAYQPMQDRRNRRSAFG
jgi:GcrA cell cycle regulator